MEAVIIPARNIPMSNVKQKTPDDGQRKCPEHVEFFDKIKFGKFVGLVDFLKRKSYSHIQSFRLESHPMIHRPIICNDWWLIRSLYRLVGTEAMKKEECLYVDARV